MRLTALLLSAALSTMPAMAQPGLPARLFVSGHSLTDNPLPPNLAEIARSLGQPILWNRQYVVGSSIRHRSRGFGNDAGWSGYATGWNREGEGLNVVEEFRHPRTTDGRPYDTLVITEQHGVLDALILHDTVRYLRHYHDRFIDGNAAGLTYFYESWLGLDDKNDPRRWIAYERAASPVWQCVVTRVNLSLAAEGRADRIASLPAGLALAELVERATQSPGVPGVSAQSVRETVDRLIGDQVHPTPLTSYYIALVTYSRVFGRSPAGAWAPPGVSSLQAESLQRVAWEAVERWRSTHKPLTLDQCRTYLRESFISRYQAHMADTYWVQQGGNPVVRWVQRMRHLARWHWRLWRVYDNDPLRFDAEQW